MNVGNRDDDEDGGGGGGGGLLYSTMSFRVVVFVVPVSFLR